MTTRFRRLMVPIRVLAGAIYFLCVPALVATTEAQTGGGDIDRLSFAYDAGSVRGNSDNVLTGAEASHPTVPSFGPVAGLDAAKSATAIGRGSTADLAKGTTLARDLREQLAIEQAMSRPSAGTELRLKMTDPRWSSSEGWVKMQQMIEPGGEPINVHYLLNKTTGQIDDFKVVIPGPRP